MAQGFVPKSIDDITADLQAAFQAVFGASINVTPQSRFGQIIGIQAERYSELWNLAATLYASFNPDDATGISLVNLAGLTGTLPVTPTPSSVTETATGTPGTVLATGRVVSVTGTGSLFISTAPATIASVSAYANAHPYLLGDRATTSGKVWQVTHPGTSSTPPTGAQGSTFTDGALTWICLGTGTGAVDFPMVSELTGPIVAAIGGLVTISTPVSGWSSAFNVGAAILGVATESDAAFRLRREEELQGLGKATIEAIRAALLKLDGVVACTVFENVTDVTNSDGMPPHSVECLVEGGNAATIAQTIFQTVAAGIATTGNQSPQTVTDSQGITHSILYSQPVVENVWITVNAIVQTSAFPSDGVQRIINNLLGYGQGLTVDYDVIATQLASAILQGVPALGLVGVPGVLDPGLPLIGFTNPPVSSATLSITSRQIAAFAQGRIVVNTTPGVP